jgi:ligand-binding sensor domain-containing protein
MGGMLHRDKGETWHKLTRADGLPSNEVLRVSAEASGDISAQTPVSEMRWSSGRSWCTATPRLPDASAQQRHEITWHGARYAADLTGFYRLAGGSWQSLPMPPTSGTHISSLADHGDSLWAGVYGDGLYAFDGARWQRAALDLPPQMREITALACTGDTVWVGTRQAGLWMNQSGRWQRCAREDEPAGTDFSALALYQNRLFAATLEDGIVTRSRAGWGHYTVGALSSSRPSQFVRFAGSLYVRHSSGKVDRLTGTVWQRNLFSRLPRRQVYTLAADDAHLYAGQWGGWSEFDGTNWQHFLKVPALQGLQITAIAPDKDRLWIGTQTHGVAEVDRKTLTVRWYDERSGLPDDWITALKWIEGRVYAGTFVGGLAIYDGARWRTVPEIMGKNVTAIESCDHGEIAAATRDGVYLVRPDGSASRLAGSLTSGDGEAQSLCHVPGGLWIGTRTALYFVREPSQNPRQNWLLSFLR